MRDDGIHPPLDSPDYKSTRLRHPKQPPVYLPHTVAEKTGPQLGQLRPGPLDHDLTRQHAGEPLGERITVSGRLLDGDGRPIRDSLIEGDPLFEFDPIFNAVRDSQVGSARVPSG